MPFGQLAIGPPGSGKTTYCNGMQQYLTLLGRKVAVVNLDPANDALPYECAVDVRDLISVEEVQEEIGLGPNGGMVYCMDYVCANLDWLFERLQPLVKENCYFLIDCPGQVELFTMHNSLLAILTALDRKLHFRLAAVHLVDAHLASDPAKYLSALLLALGAMLHLELPHVNVLSKVDLVESYGLLPFNLDFYTEATDLSHLVDAMGSDRFSQRYRKLSAGLCEVVEDFGLVRFLPLAIEDRASVARVLEDVDKANGCAFSGLASPSEPMPPELVYGAGVKGNDTEMIASLQEKYMAEELIQERPIVDRPP